MPSSLNDTGELELRDYLAVLQRRKYLIALVVVAVVAVALAASSTQTLVYSATTEVLLQPRTSERIFSPEEPVYGGQTDPVQTEIEVMASRSVREAVAEALGTEPAVSIAARGETEVVGITAESPVPADAARIANTYAETYIDLRRQELVDDLLGAASQVQSRIDAIDAQLATIDDGEATLDDEVGNRRLSLLSQRTLYTQQLDELQLSSSITERGGAKIVSVAEEPTAPVRPTPGRTAVLALFVGLILGAGIAFLFDYLDDTLKSKEDLERATDGLTVLALVPVVSGWKDKKVPYVVSRAEPSSAAAEAYRSLRTSVQFVELDNPLRIIQITSADAGEGKSTTLANLAIALGRAGRQVIIIDLDLRRPRIHDFFGLQNDTGFTSVLLGTATLVEALQEVPEESNVALLSAGHPPPNPSELLSGESVAKLLATVTNQCDVVLIDSAPVLPVTDGLIVSRLVDATLFVTFARTSTGKGTHRAIELLRQAEAPLIGSVLNGADSEALYGYGDGYSYGYGQPTPAS